MVDNQDELTMNEESGRRSAKTRARGITAELRSSIKRSGLLMNGNLLRYQTRYSMDVADIVVLAVLARINLLFVGHHATGKTELCKLLADGLSGGDYGHLFINPHSSLENLDVMAVDEKGLPHQISSAVTKKAVVFLDEINRGIPLLVQSLQKCFTARELAAKFVLAASNPVGEGYSTQKLDRSISASFLVIQSRYLTSDIDLTDLALGRAPTPGPDTVPAAGKPLFDQLVDLQPQAAVWPFTEEAAATMKALAQSACVKRKDGLKPDLVRETKGLCADCPVHKSTRCGLVTYLAPGVVRRISLLAKVFALLTHEDGSAATVDDIAAAMPLVVNAGSEIVGAEVSDAEVTDWVRQLDRSRERFSGAFPELVGRGESGAPLTPAMRAALSGFARSDNPSVVSAVLGAEFACPR